MGANHSSLTTSVSSKSYNSDWLRIQNENSAHAEKIGPGQRSRFLVLTKRSAASGDENGTALRCTLILPFFPHIDKERRVYEENDYDADDEGSDDGDGQCTKGTGV